MLCNSSTVQVHNSLLEAVIWDVAQRSVKETAKREHGVTFQTITAQGAEFTKRVINILPQ